MTEPVPALTEPASRCADRLSAADRVLIASHIDADGLTSAAIAATALERRGIPFAVSFHEQLDESAIDTIGQAGDDTVLFTDFGSGQAPAIADAAERVGFTPIVVDHHQPAEEADRLAFHCNPLQVGIDGAGELSGAGSTYVVARHLANGAAGSDDGDGANRDLAALAVVGAVGDRQLRGGELVGPNAAIASEGTQVGVLEERTQLAMYGTQTRPLPKLLEYASDVRIPGITNDRGGTIRFLREVGLAPGEGDDWPRWVDLTPEQQQTLTSSLVRRGLAAGVAPERIDDLVGTAYILSREEPGTDLRDASEFSTILNATARYDRADVGLAVCLGDRDDALRAAHRLLRNHRRQLSEGIDLVRREGVTREANVQWFHAKGRIPDTVVGIVAGMAMGSDGISGDRPMIAFAEKDDGAIKVSARGTGRLVSRGLDLAAVMHEAAGAVGGDGGGHDVAAGATIPAGEERAFVAAVDRLVGAQLGD